MISPKLLQEYERLSKAAGLALLDRTQVVMTGRDRATLLHKFCTQDVLGKTPGEGGEAFICNVQGKIVAYVYFFVEEERIVLNSAPGQGAAIIAHLDRYVITEDVQFADVSQSHANLLVCGLRVAACFERLDQALPANPCNHAPLTIAGQAVRVARVPLAKSPAWLMSVPVERLAELTVALAEAGVVKCSADAAEIIRVEAAAPLFGSDITVENLPQEVNRNDLAIHFRKGCYLGQETVARIDALGHVNKLLVSLKFAGDEVPTPGQEVKLGEKVVGRVTSAVYSPKYQAPLALAYVRREHAARGSQLDGAEVV